MYRIMHYRGYICGSNIDRVESCVVEENWIDLWAVWYEGDQIDYVRIGKSSPRYVV